MPVTIDQLAEMVQKGFEGQDKRFDAIEKDLSIIKAQLADAVLKS